MNKVTQTSRRKSDHIKVNVEEDVQSGLTTGLENYQFLHEALPELNLTSIDTSLTLLTRNLKTPLLISSMTGGTKAAQKINRNLAEAAEEWGIGMGLGSMRAAIEDQSLIPTYQVRQFAPNILLMANLGAVQLNYEYDNETCARVVEMVEADALILHLNPLQEALQPEGDTDFSDLLPKIESVCTTIGVPVIAKEVGWGISGETAKRLIDAGIAGIDVAGAGGTSWSQVEMHRAENPIRAQIAGAFRSWGIPTSDAIQYVRKAVPETLLFASGGLRNGIDLAKCIGLGADLGGMAGPFLKAALDSTEKVGNVIQQTTDELRIAMFAAGIQDLSSLKMTPRLVKAST